MIRFPQGGSRASEPPAGEGSAGAAAAAHRLDEDAAGEDAESRPRRRSERVLAAQSTELESDDASPDDLTSAEPTDPLDAAGLPEVESDEAQREAMFLRAGAAPEAGAPASGDAVETFFSSHPPSGRDPFSWLEPSGAHEGEERGGHLARRVTALIALVAVLGIGGFLAYHKLWMPTPAELGEGVVQLPTPGLVPANPVVSEEEELQEELPTQAQEPTEEEPTASENEQPEPAVEPVEEAQAAEGSAEAEPVAAEPAEGTDPAAIEAAEGPPAATPTAAAAADDDAYQQLLTQARKRGFRRKAEAIYLKALAAKPDGDEALSGLGMLLLNRGQNKQAIERASQAVGLDPTNSEGWIVLGAAHDALGDWSSARDAYRSCSEQGKGRYVVECRRMLR